MGEWNQLYFCKLLNMTSLTCDNLIFLFLAYRFYPVYYEPNFCLHLHAGYPCAPVPRWPSDNKNTTFRPWDPPEGCIRSVEVVGYGLARRKYTRVGPRGNVFMNAASGQKLTWHGHFGQIFLSYFGTEAMSAAVYSLQTVAFDQ